MELKSASVLPVLMIAPSNIMQLLKIIELNLWAILLIELRIFQSYGPELLKDTKYYHTRPKRFFTFRIHAQSVRMAVVGGGLTL